MPSTLKLSTAAAIIAFAGLQSVASSSLAARKGKKSGTKSGSLCAGYPCPTEPQVIPLCAGYPCPMQTTVIPPPTVCPGPLCLSYGHVQSGKKSGSKHSGKKSGSKKSCKKSGSKCAGYPCPPEIIVIPQCAGQPCPPATPDTPQPTVSPVNHSTISSDANTLTYSSFLGLLALLMV